jgi:hypothetical protein
MGVVAAIGFFRSNMANPAIVRYLQYHLFTFQFGWPKKRREGFNLNLRFIENGPRCYSTCTVGIINHGAGISNSFV